MRDAEGQADPPRSKIAIGVSSRSVYTTVTYGEPHRWAQDIYPRRKHGTACRFRTES